MEWEWQFYDGSMSQPKKKEAVAATHALLALKLVHTAVWAFLVCCILALPLTAWQHPFGWTAWLVLIVLAECLLLALNRGRCPLTEIAYRLTDDRSPAFDIFLPRWLARYNKETFGTLFVLNGLAALWMWLWRS